jgi:hypothetical protein
MDVLISSYIPQASVALSRSLGIEAINADAQGKRNGAVSKNEAQDEVTLSPEGKDTAQKNISSQEGETISPKTISDKEELSAEEQQQLRELKSRDREVRIHEQAHLSAAGKYAAGSASFTFQQGADGQRYAIGGEVQIDVSKAATPEETILKMNTIRSAALAPAEPSAADRQIAAQASMVAAQARQELVVERQAETEKSGNSESPLESDEIQRTDDSQQSATREVAERNHVSAMISAYTAIQDLDNSN